MQQPFEAICVLPFQSFSGDPKGSDFIVDGFCSQLSDALSLFQDISVISYTSTANYLREGGDIATIGERFNATYLLAGSVQIFEHDIQVEVELLDASDNLLLWSHVFKKYTNGDSLIEIIRSISEHIISMLVGYNGYVHLHKYAVRDISSLSPSSTTTAIFWYYHFRTRNTKEVFIEAVNRLEQAVKEDSQSALAWAVLGHLYVDGIFINSRLILNASMRYW
jgi:TolB-like protein